MAREIDILRAAARRGYAVVEKETNVLWSTDDLNDVAATERFVDTDALAAPDPHAAVTGLFPGCLQQIAQPPDLTRYRPFGQTGHFVVFEPLGD
jgi:hypothetical protein